MITLTFTNGKYNYDDHIIIFFETLKNHTEDFGYSVEIDLTGIKIKKEEFDNILSTCETYVKNNKITKIETDERYKEINDYLGTYLKYDASEFATFMPDLTSYSARHGLLDILKYAHEHGCKFNNTECHDAAQNGYLDTNKDVFTHLYGAPETSF